MCLIHYHNVSVAAANLTFHWVFGNISGEIKAVVLPQILLKKFAVSAPLEILTSSLQCNTDYT